MADYNKVYDHILKCFRARDPVSFGTGITSLNSLIANNQILQVGSAGTDFNISSSVATHTFNLPTASSANRGALSSSDWSLFNSKIGNMQQVIRVAKSGGDYTTITAALNSITDNSVTKKYTILIAGGYYNEVVNLKPFTELVAVSSRYGVSVEQININFSSASLENASLSNLIIGTLNVNFYNNAYIKYLSVINCRIVDYLNGYGEDNSKHLIEMFLSTVVSSCTFDNKLLISSRHTEIASILSLNDDCVMQHGDAELNGTFTLNDNAQFFVRGNSVHAYPLLVSVIVNVNNNAILNIDANSQATMFINKGSGVTESQIQILTGNSAGMISVIPTYTDNLDGTITVHAGQCFIYDNDHMFGLPRRFIIPEKILTLTNQANNYIQVNYNSGSPQYECVISKTTNESNIIPFYVIYKNGTELHYFGWDALGEGLPGKLHQRIVETNVFARASGLGLGEAPTRLITIESGIGWQGAVKMSFNAFNSSTDALYFYYWNGSAWVEDKTKTQYNNTQYQGPTGLVSALPNKLLINFIFRGLETTAHSYFILGTKEYVNTAAGLIEAQQAQIPASVPPIIKEHTFLVGKIIVLTAGTTATSIQSAFVQQFSVTPATSHSALSDLNSDDHLQYVLLLGRAGGQTLYGGINASNNLILRSTSNATKGQVQIDDFVYFDEINKRTGFGLVSPTAIIHLKAGTATAGTAPLKFSAGTNLTVPEAGVMEYDNNFYLTISTGNRYKIPLISGTDYELPLTFSNGVLRTVNAISLDINGLTAETSPDNNDYIPIYDVTASANRKMTRANFLSGISVADEKVKVSSNDTTASYLEDKLIVSHGTNTTNPLQLTTLNDGSNEQRQLQFDVSKVDHNSLLNYNSNKHIDHTTVSVQTTVGTSGLAGGGNISTTRSIYIDIPGTNVSITADDADKILIYDDNAGALKAQTRANFLTGYLKNVVEDTTPQLGGNLDGQLNKIENISKLALNTSNPTRLIEGIAEDGVSGISGVYNLIRYADTILSGATFQGVRARGNVLSPSKILSGDALFRFRAGGYHNGGAFVENRGIFDILAEGDWNSDTDTPTIFEFKTTPSGSSSALTRLKISSIGNIILWNTSGCADCATLKFQEKDTTPTNPTQDVEVKQYMKGDKLIWQFNNGGTVRYFYIDLTQTAAQQVQHATTPP